MNPKDEKRLDLINDLLVTGAYVHDGNCFSHTQWLLAQLDKHRKVVEAAEKTINVEMKGETQEAFIFELRDRLLVLRQALSALEGGEEVGGERL